MKLHSALATRVFPTNKKRRYAGVLEGVSNKTNVGQLQGRLFYVITILLWQQGAHLSPTRSKPTIVSCNDMVHNKSRPTRDDHPWHGGVYNSPATNPIGRLSTNHGGKNSTESISAMLAIAALAISSNLSHAASPSASSLIQNIF